jgi:hypothetical protein
MGAVSLVFEAIDLDGVWHHPFLLLEPLERKPDFSGRG